MYQIKLYKLYRDPNRSGGPRTDIIEGYSRTLPEKGKSFYLFAEGLEIVKSLRVFNTSYVTKTSQITDNIIQFNTESGSVYEIEYLYFKK